MIHDVIDTRTVGTVDGFDIEAGIVYDPDTSVDEFDCYSDEDRAAYFRDEWHYVGTIVTASKAGIELGQASIWGSEYGMLPGAEGWVSPLNGNGEDFINGYGPQLIAEAIAIAQAKIAEVSA